ncbi:MAG: hypothetical protein ACJ79O_04335 [Myxococcales bacterium]
MKAVAAGVALCAALVVPALAEEGSAIDWDLRVIRAMGKGAPDLNAPSIAVARAAAERAALAAAQRNAMKVLEGATLDDGSRVESIFRDDTALRGRVESKLRGVRAAKTHYFTDGGVWLRIEVPFSLLPPRIADHLRPASAIDAGSAALDGGAVDAGAAARDAGTVDAGAGARDAGAGARDAGAGALDAGTGAGDASIEPPDAGERSR